ncbi:unnamed protein product, partial [Adineta steineri]
DMSIMTGSQFHCVNTTCAPFTTVIVSNIFECQLACLAKFQCKAAKYQQSTSNCDLFGDLSNYNGTMVVNINVITMMVTDDTRNPPG